MSGKIALVTGATSGIGKAYADYFAGQGYDLIITGRRMDKLAQVAKELSEQYSIHVQPVSAELSEENDLENLVRIAKNNTNIEVLVNNAGFGAGMEFQKNGLEEHMRMLKVHVVTSMKLIYAILPQMIRRRKGVIINVSSLAAYMPAPGSAMYTATKLFLKGFSESLHMEVHNSGIKIQCLCPGFTHTDFHDRRSVRQVGNGHGLMWMDADRVVEESIRALKKNMVVCLPGYVNKALVRLCSLLPRKIYYFLMELAGRPDEVGKAMSSNLTISTLQSQQSAVGC